MGSLKGRNTLEDVVMARSGWKMPVMVIMMLKICTLFPLIHICRTRSPRVSE